MMMRSTCLFILINLWLVVLVMLPKSTLALDKPSSGYHQRDMQPVPGDPEISNHMGDRKFVPMRWPEDPPRNTPIIFPGKRISISNANKNKARETKSTHKAWEAKSTIHRNKHNRKNPIRYNKNRDARENLPIHLNKNSNALNFPTPKTSQEMNPVKTDLSLTHPKKNQGASHTKGKKKANKGIKGKWRNGGKNNRRIRKRRTVKLNTKNFMSFQKFGMNLHKAVSNLSQKSFIMSPFSAWSALILAYYGSDGKTEEQFENAMGVQKKPRANARANALTTLLEDTKSGAILRTTNKAYVANDMVLKPRISKMLKNIEHLDFTDERKARFLINSEVSNVTEGKIPELVRPGDIDASSRFVLVNAVYFKGKWLNSFDKKETIMKPFYDLNGNFIANVDMMHTTAHFRVGHLENRMGQLLEMQYVASSVVMHIVLPNRNIDIKTLVQSLDQEAFANALKTTYEMETDVALPKFKLETRLEHDLEQAIRSLGITEMFDNPDLSAFTGKNEVAQVKIVQQSVIEVDEEGTEAAAATMVAGFRMYTEPESFIVDRPFAFYINEMKTKVTVFSGIYMGPSDVKEN